MATHIKEDLQPKLLEKTKDDRILIVAIKKENKWILIVNLYAPNLGQKKFIKRLQKNPDKTEI